VVDHGYTLQSGQPKYYDFDFGCFYAKNAQLKTNIKDWLARNQDNISEWCDISTHGLAVVLLTLHSKNWYKVDIIISSSNVTCSCHDMID
jgi:hypothetical protein